MEYLLNQESMSIVQMNATNSFTQNAIRVGKIGNALKRLQDSIANQLSIGSPSGALLVIVENQELLSDLRTENEEVFFEFESLRTSLTQIATASAADFPARFPRIAETLGLVFCEGTLHPKYLLDRGFIEVRLNSRRLCVQFQTRGGREQAIGLEPEVVLDAIQKTLQRLHARTIAPAELLTRVKNTFEQTSRQSGQLGSDQVMLRDFLKNYQKNYKCLPDESIIDLSLAKQQFAEINLDYIRDHEQGFLLYGFEENGYFGFIRIEGQAHGS
jgi:hypothetical protein